MNYVHFPYNMSKAYGLLKYLLDMGNVLIGKIYYQEYKNYQVIQIKKIGKEKTGYYNFGVLGCGFLTIDGACTEKEFMQKCKEYKVEFIRPNVKLVKFVSEVEE